MLPLTLHVAQPPSAVLTALRKHGAEWRESRLPDAIRGSGIFGVVARVSSTGITLRYDRNWYSPLNRTAPLSLRAVVLADGDECALVHVTVSRRLSLRYTLIGTALFIVLGAGLLRLPALPVAALFIALFGFNHWLVREADSSLDRATDPEVDYLIQRVEDAVARAGMEK